VRIAAGTAVFASTFSQSVAFTSKTGVLELAKSQSYAGTISGFSLTGGTSLDLTDVVFASAKTKATFVENGAKTSGVLTVTDGTHSAHITLAGNFSSSTFTTSSDGHGGTSVVDPPKIKLKPAAVALDAAPHAKTSPILPFVSAMASFDNGGGQWISIFEPGRSNSAALAITHQTG
jgi:hypothetical protein